MKRFCCHAELENWTGQEKLLQLELRVCGKAEKLHEVLTSEEKKCFSKAVKALGHRLQPASSKALLSAQLMKRKQQVNESVDAYSKDFESLFEKVLVKVQLWIKLPKNY